MGAFAHYYRQRAGAKIPDLYCDPIRIWLVLGGMMIVIIHLLLMLANFSWGVVMLVDGNWGIAALNLVVSAWMFFNPPHSFWDE